MEIDQSEDRKSLLIWNILSLQNTVVMAYLKYMTGAIQGKPLKRKVAPEETRERNKKLERTWME
jgi:hypothetical protein